MSSQMESVTPDVSLPSDITYILEEFDTIVKNLALFKSNITELQQKIRNLEKNVRKEIKVIKKNVTKNKKKGNKNPSGFAHPTKISKELCEFMNINENSEIARTDVTISMLLLHQYVQFHYFHLYS